MRTLALTVLAGLAVACAPMPEGGVASPQQCDADAARSLIGQNVAAVSFPADANVRVVCTTCPTTKDLRPNRLNVRFDQETGIIQQIDCG